LVVFSSLYKSKERNAIINNRPLPTVGTAAGRDYCRFLDHPQRVAYSILTIQIERIECFIRFLDDHDVREVYLHQPSNLIGNASHDD
jgi:hypothetical protein